MAQIQRGMGYASSGATYNALIGAWASGLLTRRKMLRSRTMLYWLTDEGCEVAEQMTMTGRRHACPRCGTHTWLAQYRREWMCVECLGGGV